MKSEKLMNLGRRKALSPTFNWIAQCNTEAEQNSGGGELLDISYPEWCSGLRIKTAKGMKPFYLFSWQLKTVSEKLLVVGQGNRRRKAGRSFTQCRQTGKTSMLAIDD